MSSFKSFQCIKHFNATAVIGRSSRALGFEGMDDKHMEKARGLNSNVIFNALPDEGRHPTEI
jgi:hypothetical protein